MARKVIGIGETILDILFKKTNLQLQFREVLYLMESYHWAGWE